MFDRFDRECTARTPSAGRERGDRLGGVALVIEGELGVALVARDDDAAISGPVDLAGQRVGGRGDASRVGWVVEPDEEGPLGIRWRHAGEVGAPVRIDRNRHRPETREGGPIA